MTKARAMYYFRNAVHFIYREIRHVGTQHDPEAKAVAPDSLAEQAALCARNRKTLKSTVPYTKVLGYSTDDYLRPYVDLTSLHLDRLPELFADLDWVSGYGGKRYFEIARVVNELKRAIDANRLAIAESLCDELRNLQHNTGPVIPTYEEWRRNKRLQEKWPEM